MQQWLSQPQTNQKFHYQRFRRERAFKKIANGSIDVSHPSLELIILFQQIACFRIEQKITRLQENIAIENSKKFDKIYIPKISLVKTLTRRT
eukprot:GAHX01003992.1.p1 GENE.GAHX01003992.1~~GAHX01003992.1.p1  ORF type:complete len:92 (+),score=9.94 GAHX01003992.1:275-550(+)